MTNAWSSGRWRTPLAVLSMALLCVGGYLTAMLYAGIAPFKQLYNVATADQDAAVTQRIIGATILLPLALAGLLVIWRVRPGVNARRAIRMVAIVLFLSGLHSCSITARLPYGFGSSYEHASKEQLRHLDLSRNTGNAFLLAGLMGLVWSLVMPKNGRQESNDTTITG